MHIYPSDLHNQWGLNDLKGQFILCEDNDYIPETWSKRRLDGRIIGTHPSLNVIDIYSGEGCVVGWIVGNPIHLEGGLVKHTYKIQGCTNDADFFESFENELYALSGRFIAFIVAHKTPRCYLDSCGSMAAVYSRRHRAAASSPSLIPYTDGCDDDQELIQVLGIPGKRAWYPFGLTPRFNIRRILPNHFLDLNLWQPKRHWPVGDFEEKLDPEIVAHQIASIVQNSIAAVTREYKPHMSLTAGMDSRLLLACARNHVDDINFFTGALPDKIGRLDCRIAKLISKQFGLSHRILEMDEASESEKAQWLHKTGCCVGESRGINGLRIFKQIDADTPHMPGLVGEISRATFRHGNGHQSTALSAEALLNKLQIPTAPKIVKAGKQWLSGVPLGNQRHILDIFHLEQRLGCWAGPLHYGEFPFRIYPLCHRSVIEGMVKLPTEYKMQGLLPAKIIGMTWPELLRYPFNREIGIRRYIGTGRWYAQKVQRKLSRIVGL